MQAASLAGHVTLVVLAQGTFVGCPVDLRLQIGIRHDIVVRSDNAQAREAMDCNRKVASGFHEEEADHIRTCRYQEFFQECGGNGLGFGAAFQ